MNASNPYAPPTATVTDVAGDVTYEHADRGVRLGAAFVDGIISTALALPMIIAMWPLLLSMAAGNTDPSAWAGAIFGIAGLMTGVLMIAWVVVTIYLVNKNGQTIGKKLLGIKVVRSDGSRASLGRIFWLRNFVNALPGIIPFLSYIYMLADHLWIFGEARQCLHDKIADTIVVKA